MNNNPMLFSESTQRPVEMENLKSLVAEPVTQQQVVAQPVVQRPVVHQPPQAQTVGPSAEILAMEEQTSLILFVIGFMSHWVWLVGWLRYRSSQSTGARRWSKWSKVLFLLHTFFVVSILCLVCVVVVGSVGFTVVVSGGGHGDESWDDY